MHDSSLRSWLRAHGVVRRSHRNALDVYHRLLQFLFVDVVQPQPEIRRAVAEFRCARKPAPEDLERLGDALKKRRGYAKIEFHVVLDPSLLGGFVIRLGGVTYDKSVKAMLQGLGRSLKGRE